MGVLQLKVETTKLNGSGQASVEISGYHVPINDEPGSIELAVNAQNFDIQLTDDEGNIRDQNEVLGEVSQFVQDYISDNGLSRVTSYSEFVASKRVRASFIKEGETGEVSITAINASTNIKAAMDIIYDIVEDDDFVDQLEDDTEQSFEITDQDYDYDIGVIDDVDVDDTYISMFNMVSQFNNKLETLRWALGRSIWDKDSTLVELQYGFSDLIEEMAVWVIEHTDRYPVSVAPFGNDSTDLADYKDDQGQLSSDIVHDSIKQETEDLLEYLEIYYINLEHEEQSCLDSAINHIKGILVYA